MPWMWNACSGLNARTRHERQPRRDGDLLKRKAVELRPHVALESRFIARLRGVLALPLTIAPMRLGYRNPALAIRHWIAAGSASAAA